VTWRFGQHVPAGVVQNTISAACGPRQEAIAFPAPLPGGNRPSEGASPTWRARPTPAECPRKVSSGRAIQQLDRARARTQRRRAAPAAESGDLPRTATRARQPANIAAASASRYGTSRAASRELERLNCWAGPSQQRGGRHWPRLDREKRSAAQQGVGRAAKPPGTDPPASSAVASSQSCIETRGLILGLARHSARPDPARRVEVRCGERSRNAVSRGQFPPATNGPGSPSATTQKKLPIRHRRFACGATGPGTGESGVGMRISYRRPSAWCAGPPCLAAYVGRIHRQTAPAVTETVTRSRSPANRRPRRALQPAPIPSRSATSTPAPAPPAGSRAGDASAAGWRRRTSSTGRETLLNPPGNPWPHRKRRHHRGSSSQGQRIARVYRDEGSAPAAHPRSL